MSQCCHICLTIVDEVHDSLEVFQFHPLQIDQRVIVSVSLEYLLKEGAGSGQDDFVGFNLHSILTGQGYIREVLVISKTSKRQRCVLLEIVPLQP